MKRTVYVLGAGFSALAGIPMMDGFLHEAQQMFYRDEVNPPHDLYYNTVFDHAALLGRCSRFIEFNFHNLEDVFGLIEIANTLGDQGIGKESSGVAFRRLVKHVIERKQYLYLKNERNRGIYATFISDFIVRCADTTALVTFNYDEVIESTVAFHDEKNPGARWPPLRVHFEQDIPDAIDLFKLHGSISWERDDGAPHIIPPTWNKSLSERDREVFDPIWTGGSAHIAGAERIIFIGYSLPTTDQYVRQFLAYSLAKNERLSEVIVVDPSKKVAKRFRALLDRSFQGYFKHYQVKFEELGTTGQSRIAQECAHKLLNG